MDLCGDLIERVHALMNSAQPELAGEDSLMEDGGEEDAKTRSLSSNDKPIGTASSIPDSSR